MKKSHKITYWIATLWLSLGMVSTGVVQIMQVDDEIQKINALGCPAYLLIIVGTWKLLGVIAVLIPKFPLMKEWAYAGFFFLMTGAIFIHIAAGDELVEFFGPSLLLALTIISWLYRPAERRVQTPRFSF